MTHQDFGQLHRLQKKKERFVSWKALFYIFLLSLFLSFYINSFFKQQYIFVPVAQATDLSQVANSINK